MWSLLPAQRKAIVLVAMVVMSSSTTRVMAQPGPPSAGDTSGSPFATNRANGPFTFDGFEFGFGGLNVNDPNLLTRALTSTVFNRLFNNPFLGYVTQGVSNQVRRPTDYLPWYLRQSVQRPVTQLFGWDIFDRALAQIYSLPTSNGGAIRPAGCIGPIYVLNVDGGNCTVSPTNGQVTCFQPTLSLSISPLQCSGFWRQGAAFSGPLVRPNIQLTPLRGGYIYGRPALVDFGTALNLTRVQLGFNINARRYLNDFGVTRYYFYLVAFLGFLLLRVARALIATPLPTLLRNAAVNITGSRPQPLGDPISGRPDPEPDLIGAIVAPNGTLFGFGPAGVERALREGFIPCGSLGRTVPIRQGCNITTPASTSTSGSPRASTQAGGPNLSGDVVQRMERALLNAFARLSVNRTSMPVANAFLNNPEALIARAAKSLQGVGATGLAQNLRDALAAGRRPTNGSTSQQPSSSATASNRIGNQQLGNPNFGTFDAQGNYNPGQPTSKGTTADVNTLLWRRNNNNQGTGASSDDVLHQQLGQRMRSLLPNQASALDNADALGSTQPTGFAGFAQDLLSGLGSEYGTLSDLLNVGGSGDTAKAA